MLCQYTAVAMIAWKLDFNTTTNLSNSLMLGQEVGYNAQVQVGCLFRLTLN